MKQPPVRRWRPWALSVIDWQSRLTAKHIFTHVEWHMTGYALTVRGDGPAELEWVDAAGLAARSVPSAFAGIMKKQSVNWR